MQMVSLFLLYLRQVKLNLIWFIMDKKSKSNIKMNDGNFALCCVDHLTKKIFRHAPRLPDFGNSARCPIMNERFQIVEWFKVTFFLMSNDYQ